MTENKDTKMNTVIDPLTMCQLNSSGGNCFGSRPAFPDIPVFNSHLIQSNCPKVMALYWEVYKDTVLLS